MHSGPKAWFDRVTRPQGAFIRSVRLPGGGCGSGSLRGSEQRPLGNRTDLDLPGHWTQRHKDRALVSFSMGEKMKPLRLGECVNERGNSARQEKI